MSGCALFAQISAFLDFLPGSNPLLAFAVKHQPLTVAILNGAGASIQTTEVELHLSDRGQLRRLRQEEMLTGAELNFSSATYSPAEATPEEAQQSKRN